MVKHTPTIVILAGLVLGLAVAPGGCGEAPEEGVRCGPAHARSPADGWEACRAEGGETIVGYHRAEVALCPVYDNAHALTECEDGYGILDYPPGESVFDECASIDDCPGSDSCYAGQVGVCAGCGCTHACAGDADCDPGSFCACGGAPYSREVSKCVRGCSGPSDCGGSECAVAFDDCGVFVGTFCRNDRDACAFDSDCEGGAICAWSVEEQHFHCGGALCDC